MPLVSHLGALQDMAHAAASVHATVMSEEDAMSERETHLSSRRAAASHSAPARAAEAGPGADVEERQASHHTAGVLCRPVLICFHHYEHPAPLFCLDA